MKGKLTSARPGDLTLVSSIDATSARTNKLASLGILPGVLLRVHQRKPVVVVECDETVLAIEHELAECIHVVDAPSGHR